MPKKNKKGFKKLEYEAIPANVLEKYDPEERKQMTRGFQILQQLVKLNGSKMFMEEPGDLMNGIKVYQTLIKTPMWFSKVKSKFLEGSYNRLMEAIMDIRLIFENCYYFWGPKDKITTVALKMEHLLEKELAAIGGDTMQDCSLEVTHGYWSNQDLEEKYYSSCNFHKPGEPCSNLVLRMWEVKRKHEQEEYKKEVDLTIHQSDVDVEKLKIWENETFPDKIKKHIYTMWELPHLGQFIHLVLPVTSLEPICQKEIEMMLVVPESSSALSNIITAFLSPESNADKVVLKYEEWNEKLTQLVSSWYEEYDKFGHDARKMMELFGIESIFFEIIGIENPLRNKKFHELLYLHKIWLLTGLCQYLSHKEEKIAKCAANEGSEDAKINWLGRDKDGNDYIYFPRFVDYRVYRQFRIKENEDESARNSKLVTQEEKEEIINRYSCCPWKGSVMRNFRLDVVADSIESLRAHIDQLIINDFAMRDHSKASLKSSNEQLINSLLEFSRDTEAVAFHCIRYDNLVRVKLFKECSNSYAGENLVIVPKKEKVKRRRKRKTYELVEQSKEGKLKLKVTENGESDNMDSETRITRKRKKLTSGSEVLEYDEPEDVLVTDIENETSDSEDDWCPLKNRVKKKELIITLPKTTLKDKLAKKTKEQFKKVKPMKVEETCVKNNKNIKVETMEENELWSKDVKKQQEEESELASMAQEIQKTKEEKNVLAPVQKDVQNRTANEVEKIKTDQRLVKKEKTEGTIIEINANIPRIGQEVNNSPITNNASEVSTNYLYPPSNANATSLANTVQTISSLPSGFPTTPNSVSSPLQVPRSSFNSSLTRFMQYSPVRPFTSRQMRPTSTPQRRAIFPQPFPTRIRSQSSGRLPSKMPKAFPSLPRHPCPPVRRRTPIKSPTPSPSREYTITPVKTPERKITNVSRTSLTPENIRSRGEVTLMSSGQSITITPKKPQSLPKRLFKTEVEGVITIRIDCDVARYAIKLANGTVLPLSIEQINELKRQNNGTLPATIKIPVPADVADEIEPCLIIDD